MLELCGIGKRYGNRELFRDLDLYVPPGIWLLTGANGAGKTTLLGIMAGVIAPACGEVITDLPPGAIGYLGHTPLLYPRLTALENLRFWTRLHRSPSGRNDCLDMLERMNLLAFAHERAATFSRGMLQRLSLARLLLLAPRLLLLDEPGTGLDAASQELLVAQMQRFRAEGGAIVWVSHQQTDRELADGVYILVDGKLIGEEG